jgi:hypothetical protein
VDSLRVKRSDETVTPYINQPSMPCPWLPRAQADAILDSLAPQIERVRNNGARRRLRKALAKAKEKRARTLEIERMRAENARTLTIDLPAGVGPGVSVFRSAHPPMPIDELVRVEHTEGVR